jgi:Uncharacterized conserved protein (DUF2203)
MSTSIIRTVDAAWVGWDQAVFSVAQSRRALAYLATVVRDAVEAYHVIMHCRVMLKSASEAKEIARWSTLRDQALRQLNRAADDCNAVGADLLDLSVGQIRLAAMIEDRAVSLLWRLGEPVEGRWAELEPAAAMGLPSDPPAPLPGPPSAERSSRHAD